MSATASDVVAALRAGGHTIATAESLTGGLLCATLVDVPGASDVVAGGVVAYSPQVKVDLLGVSADVLAEHGTVHEVTAVQMARGAVEQIAGATLGIATTGVAGPDPIEGKPVGTVFIALADSHEARHDQFAFNGTRAEIREQAVAAAFSMLLARLEEETAPSSG